MQQMSHITFAMLALFSFLTVGLSTGPVAAAPGSANSAPPSTVQPFESENQAALIDINSASLKELRTLPGIGSVYSKKIVEGRPYRAVEELSMRKVLPEGAYAKIQNKIVAKPE